jgi:hypothetical protein
MLTQARIHIGPPAAHAGRLEGVDLRQGRAWLAGLTRIWGTGLKWPNLFCGIV